MTSSQASRRCEEMTAQPHGRAPRAARRERILIVEDDPDLLALFAGCAKDWGYEALVAQSGEEGLQMAQTQPPDLVLLDILLPTMKGREVCARLKADPQTRDIPVIFLTALKLEDHVKAGLELGAEVYLTKPWDAEELKTSIHTCLLRRRILKTGSGAQAGVGEAGITQGGSHDDSDRSENSHTAQDDLGD